MLEPVYPPVSGSTGPTGRFEPSFKTMNIIGASIRALIPAPMAVVNHLTKTTPCFIMTQKDFIFGLKGTVKLLGKRLLASPQLSMFIS